LLKREFGARFRHVFRDPALRIEVRTLFLNESQPIFPIAFPPRIVFPSRIQVKIYYNRNPEIYAAVREILKSRNIEA